MSIFFLLAFILGVCTVVPIVLYAIVGWPEYLAQHQTMNNSGINAGVTAAMIIGGIGLAPLITYLVFKVFWWKYKKPFTQLKHFVIDLFDQDIINVEKFCQLPNDVAILVLTKVNKFRPDYRIRFTKEPISQLVELYQQTKGKNHNERVEIIANTIKDVPLIQNYPIVSRKSNYDYPIIFLLCGAIYQNVKRQTNKKI